jgi:hypothetical protein
LTQAFHQIDGAAGANSDGLEILLYDYHRRPRNWSEIIQLHQCAVFVRDVRRGCSASRQGTPQTAATATCILFDSVDRAESVCREIVNANPNLTCEILDYEGPMNPPLLTVCAGEAGGGDDDMRGWIAKNRKLVASIAIAGSILLFCYDFLHKGPLVLTVIGINLIAAALRFLLWDAGAKRNERTRLARLNAHRQRERADRQDGSGAA